MKNYEYKNRFVSLSATFKGKNQFAYFVISHVPNDSTKNYHKIFLNRSCMYLSCHQTSEAISQCRVQISHSESEVCSIDDAAHVIRTSA